MLAQRPIGGKRIVEKGRTEALDVEIERELTHGTSRWRDDQDEAVSVDDLDAGRRPQRGGGARAPNLSLVSLALDHDPSALSLPGQGLALGTEQSSRGPISRLTGPGS